MVNNKRSAFFEEFQPSHYQRLTDDLHSQLGFPVAFRVAETPLFVSDDMAERLLTACRSLPRQLRSATYYQQSESAIPIHQKVGGNDQHLPLMVADFAVCKDEKGDFTPQLIELQGFPTLFAYQQLLAKAYQQHYPSTAAYHAYTDGYNADTFKEMMGKLLLGSVDPEQVLLIDIDPLNQKTRADFEATRLLYGINYRCISELERSGKQLYYRNSGKKIPVKRLYNRVIFDELEKRPERIREFSLLEEINAEWVIHPNWFFRISKYSLPYLNGDFVPETHFVNQLNQLPKNLSDWVLKPLYGFAGSGVKLHPTVADLKALKQPAHFILQKKVNYSPVFDSPAGPVKAEIRMMLFWPEGSEEVHIATNLCRLSRGEMIGVGYNQNDAWVGSSSAFFHQLAV